MVIIKPKKKAIRLRQNPSKIIIHAMGEFVNGMYAPYFIKSIGLSVHYYITPSGVIINSVDPERKAYHARGHNAGSIGIEFLVPGEYGEVPERSATSSTESVWSPKINTYEDFLNEIKTDYILPTQRLAGTNLVIKLSRKYGIDEESIFRHSDLDPNRKKDPGAGFPWEYFMYTIFGF